MNKQYLTKEKKTDKKHNTRQDNKRKIRQMSGTRNVSKSAATTTTTDTHKRHQ